MNFRALRFTCRVSLPCRADFTAGFPAPGGSTVSRLYATFSRFAANSAAAGTSSIVRHRQAVMPWSPASGWADSGWRPITIRPPSHLADKILFDQKSVTVSDRHDRTRLWAPSLPVISPCVQLVARFSG
jgi:hypothetical protein